MKKGILLVSLLLGMLTSYAQQQFQVVNKGKDYQTYYIADKQGNVIKKLDNKYRLAFQPETTGYFAIFAIDGQEGWTAIDMNERILFQVYNTEMGTPSPDELRENRIRIVKDGKIGFANEKGVVVIEPQYEAVTSFHKGKAIIGTDCQHTLMGKEEQHPGDCHHYSTTCKQSGYINLKGEILLLGDYTFEAIAKKIKWKDSY
jgi:hypothetical protein